MPILPSILYRNPQEIIDTLQQRSCTGCKHESLMRIADKDYMACKRMKRHSDMGGSRCGQYGEKV